jgi:hypothetical protein
MQKTTKFSVAVLASLCFFYLLVLVTKTYAWVTIPFIILSIILLWKKDRYIGMGAFIAFVMSLIAIVMIFYGVTDMKIVF